jgi:hypothetical protein
MSKRYTKVEGQFLEVGKYRAIYKANIFPNQLEWLIENLSGIAEKTYEFLEGKPIRITEVYQIEKNNDTFIAIEFELLNNPVPVALIVGGIIGLLGMVGILLVFDRIEKISESPLGTGIGFSLTAGSIALLVAGGFYLYKVYNN